jgi:hypothetical protein
MKAESNITQLTDTENLSESFSAKLASTFRSLQYRNYRLFFFGQIISLSGTWMQWSRRIG